MSDTWRRPLWLIFLDRTNFTVTFLTACVIVYTRSVGIIYFAAGSVLCSFNTKLLKLVIRQPRPVHHNLKRKSTYGMPSTHSATISFFATYITLACLYLPTHPSLPSGGAFRALILVTVLPWALLIVMSRVWLDHHTWPQVIVGAVCGLVFAFSWYTMWVTGFKDGYGRIAEETLNSWLEF
ncbi:PAP2-domain-containing protein [Infundibulicybe gibba]|nr:PAP2-domain-containing protein [Infundibulicybe gibba]